MKDQDYRPNKTGKPKRNGNLSRRKRQMIVSSKERSPFTSPELRKACSSKTEWVKKLIPKLRKEGA